MKKATVIWIIVATSLMLAGIIVIGVGSAMFKWDFSLFSGGKYETKTYAVNEEYSNITVSEDTADVVFLPSEDGSTTVVCDETEKIKHRVEVKDGALCITVEDSRKWYQHISLFFKAMKVTVYIPEGEYGKLSVKSDTGSVNVPVCFSFESIDIKESTGSVKCSASAGDVKIRTSTGSVGVSGFTCDSLDIKVSTGSVTVKDGKVNGEIKVKVSTGSTKLEDIECESLTSDGDTGSITMKSVIASGKLSVSRSTGSVKFDGSDAAEIDVDTDTGSVSGTLLSDKIFIAESDTGSVSVPKTTSGGKCEISTSTGSIRISIE
ncbi:MAG: DUF4097 domain-containing protein [Ruminococcaceae bacterium]|nr:DUF4097 domain-containing protein [Oscillospiraceae bacterium]